MPEQRRIRTGTAAGDRPSRGSEAQARSAAVVEVGPAQAARSACEELEGLIGHSPEGVCAVRRTEHGWCVAVDVLEVPRIPDTTSLLATYEVELDADGRLLEYRRVRRYRRGTADD